jgi:hypothetical protein
MASRSQSGSASLSRESVNRHSPIRESIFANVNPSIENRQSVNLQSAICNRQCSSPAVRHSRESVNRHSPIRESIFANVNPSIENRQSVNSQSAIDNRQ